MMCIEAFALGGMNGWAQGLFLVCFSFVQMAAVLFSPPAVLLAQSRADSIDCVGKFLTYCIYSMIFPGWITVGEAAQAMAVVSAIMLVHAIFTALEPVVKAATFTFGALLVSLGLTKSPTPLLFQEGTQRGTLDDLDDKEQGVTNLGELPSTEEAVAFVWHKLAAHVNSEGSFPATLYKALTITSAANKKRGPRGFVFDNSTFDEGLAPLYVKGMTAQIADVLLLQATHTSSGKLMTVVELLQLLNEPKYSSDGKISRLERASRSLSIDEELPPAKLKSSRTSRTPTGIRNSKSDLLEEQRKKQTLQAEML